MILLISARDQHLDSPTDNRFGRSPWLIRIDTKTNQWKAFPNPGASQSGGAGVAAGQFAVDQQADVVISGDFGPNASSTLRAANVEMRLLTGEISTVQQAVEFFLQGKLPVMN